MKRVVVAILAAACAAASALAANTCYWIADKGSGSWTDPDCWIGGTMPANGNGDTVYLSNTVGNVTITVPDAIAIKHLYIGGTKGITLTGAAITLSAGNLYVNRGTTLIENDITVAGQSEPRLHSGVCYDNGQFGAQSRGRPPSDIGEIRFTGTISVGASATSVTTVRVGGWIKMTFEGPVNLTTAVILARSDATGVGTGGGNLNWSNGQVHFKGPVTAKAVRSDNYSQSKFYFYSSENAGWTSLKTVYGDNYLMGDGVLPETTVISWHNLYLENNDGTTYYFDGHGQTADRIDYARYNKDGDGYQNETYQNANFNLDTPNGKPLTLTLKGTADASAFCNLKGPFSLVWDPSDDFTQVFTGRVMATTGDLTVKGGTLKMDSKCTFAFVPKISVLPKDVEKGARFLVASAEDQSLKALKTLEIGAGGTFEVVDGATPFAENAVNVSLASSGVLKVGDATDYSFNNLKVGDTYLEAGWYTGEGGPDDCTVVPQISGKGRIFVVSAVAPSGVTCTWTGGSGVWSEKGNWQDDRVPAEGDAVVLTPSADGAEIENDIDDLRLVSVTYAGSNAFTLSGKTLVTMSLSDQIVDKTVTTACGFLVSNDATLSVETSSKAANSLTGVISGAGAVKYTGKGSALIEAANTYAGGTRLYNAKVYANNVNAFGQAGTPVATVDEGTATSVILLQAANGTFANDFSFATSATLMNPLNANVDGLVTVAKGKELTVQACNEYSVAASGPTKGTNLHFLGEVTGEGTVFVLGRSESAVYFDGGFTAAYHRMPSGSYGWSGGVSHFTKTKAEGDASAGRVSASYSTLYADAVDVFGPECQLDFSDYSGSTAINLTGHDQHVGYLSTFSYQPSYPNGGADGRKIISDTSATLFLSMIGSKGIGCHTIFRGKVSLCVDAVDPSAVQTITNTPSATRQANCDTAGDLMASNGTLRLGEYASFAKVPALRIGSQGVIEVQTSVAGALKSVRTIDIAPGGRLLLADVAAAALATDAPCIDLSLGTGSELRIPAGVRLQLQRLTVAGELVAGGRTLSAADLAELGVTVSGGGDFYLVKGEMPTKPATWTGLGATISAALADNWNTAPTLPVQTDGSLLATFAAGGHEAVIPEGYEWKGIAFSGAGAADFTISGAPLTLRELGIVQDDSLTNTLAAPLAVATAQAWSVGKGSILNVRGGISKPEGAVQLTKDGKGILNLYGENSLPGELAVSNGELRVYGSTNCLGRADEDGRIYVRQGHTENGKIVNDGTCIRFMSSGTVERPIDVSAANDNGGFIVMDNVTNVFTKKVSALSNHPRFTFCSGSRTVFAGGLDVTGGGWFCPNGSSDGEVIVAKDKSNLGYCYLSVSPVVCLRSADNSIGTIELHTGGQLRLEVPDALHANTTYILAFANAATGAPGYIDLCGCDNSFGRITWNGKGGGEIRSSTGPALFTFTQGVGVTNTMMAFTGGLSIKKRGSALFVQSRDIAATGSLEVAEGTFAFAGGGRWKACTGVTVDAGAKLLFKEDLAAIRPFSGRAALTVADGGTVEVEQGRIVRVGTLVVKGVDQGIGLFGGPECTVPGCRKLSCLAGKGAIQAVGTGNLLLVR